jgi:hypothetical protein
MVIDTNTTFALFFFQLGECFFQIGYTLFLQEQYPLHFGLSLSFLINCSFLSIFVFYLPDDVIGYLQYLRVREYLYTKEFKSLAYKEQHRLVIPRIQFTKEFGQIYSTERGLNSVTNINNIIGHTRHQEIYTKHLLSLPIPDS